MVVASLQLQQKELQSLRQQVQTLQAATRTCAKKK
jgi:hypothetical protein